MNAYGMYLGHRWYSAPRRHAGVQSSMLGVYTPLRSRIPLRRWVAMASAKTQGPIQHVFPRIRIFARLAVRPKTAPCCAVIVAIGHLVVVLVGRLLSPRHQKLRPDPCA